MKVIKREEKMSFFERLKKMDNWTKLAGVIILLTGIFSVWMIGTVASLNMLPIPYILVLALLLVLLLTGTIWTLLLPSLPAKDGKKKKSATPAKRLVLRCVGLVLALCIVVVDAVGINMIRQLQTAINEIVDDEDEVVYEVVGIYVVAEDEAEELKDIADYDLGVSYAYNTETLETAVEMMETSFDKEFDWNEFDTVVESVDALLDGEVGAILMNISYLSVLESIEGYEEIENELKLLYEFEMEDTSLPVIELSTKPEDITKDPFIVYISGHDTDYTLKNQRSDVNILAVVNPETKQVLLINTPRDYYVSLVGSKGGDGQYDKLTHCGIYGIECSMATLGNLYDQDIHYYAQVSFVGFKRLINALGGITVYSDTSFYAAESGTQISKGENYLNGEQALGFVRERHNLAQGDIARGRNQMAVVQAIIKKAASSAILTSYAEVLESMGDCFGTNLTSEEASNLVKMQLSDMATWNIKSFTVLGQGSGSSSYCYSIPNQKVYVFLQDETYVTKAQALIDKVFDGGILTDEDLVVQ